jgi:hypothetical protein
LNRPYLITEGKFDITFKKFKYFIIEAKELRVILKNLPDSLQNKYLHKILEIYEKINELNSILRNLPLYNSGDLR